MKKSTQRIKRFVLTLGALWCSACSATKIPPYEQPSFPAMVAYDLEDVGHALPHDFQATCTMVVFSFSHDQRPLGAEWINHLKQEVRPEKVALFYMPVVGDLPLITGMIRRSMRDSDSLPLPRGQVLPFFGDKEGLMAAMRIENEESPYIAVIDHDGKVRSSTRGPWSSARHRRLVQGLAECGAGSKKEG